MSPGLFVHTLKFILHYLIVVIGQQVRNESHTNQVRILAVLQLWNSVSDITILQNVISLVLTALSEGIFVNKK